MNERLYRTLLRIANSFGYIIAQCTQGKIALWFNKRKALWETIDHLLASNTSPLIWVHVSSRGETEQVLPLISLIKRTHPEYKVFLTIFSPSAERVLPEVDYMCYLPLDSPRNAERLLDKLQPKLVLWVKYDFWYFYLKAIHQRNIPLVLISSIFKKDGTGFRTPYRNFYLRMLSFFSKIHVQNEDSKLMLQSFGINDVSVSGDTRFDRVKALSEVILSQKKMLPRSIYPKILVCGSTKKEDYPVLQELQSRMSEEIYFVIVPHDIDRKDIDYAKKFFQNPICFSQLDEIPRTAHTLIVDKMGVLMNIYAEADICYVGGGLSSKGIHNTLEPASFGKPIFIGENYQAYHEAVQMCEQGICIVVKNGNDLYEKVTTLFADNAHYFALCKASKEFVSQHSGVSEKILQDITEHQWL